MDYSMGRFIRLFVNEFICRISFSEEREDLLKIQNHNSRFTNNILNVLFHRDD